MRVCTAPLSVASRLVQVCTHPHPRSAALLRAAFCPRARLLMEDAATSASDAPSSTAAVRDDAHARLLVPPACVRGMTVLDRSAFRRMITCPCLRVDAKDTSLFLKRLGPALLNLPKTRSVEKDGSDAGKRLVLLSPTIAGDQVMEVIPESARTLAEEKGAVVASHDVEFGYDRYTADQVLRAVLPPSFGDITTSYEAVGHIAHVNLRDHELPYKALIGAVLLDKSAGAIRTVVNKASAIESKFRFFPMEVIAGDADMAAEVHENGCVFKFDYARVYWNSRLQMEHSRVVDALPRDAVLLDMCAGVGPFAIPAAKKGCFVYANDLNPASHEALCSNARANKVEGRVRAFNMDARDFVAHVAQRVNTGRDWPPFTHVTMNLPALSLELLSCLRGVFASLPAERVPARMPTILCHCFTSADDPAGDVTQRAALSLGLANGKELKSLCGGAVDVREVRDVAPKKLMMCISFMLPRSVALAGPLHAALSEQTGAGHVGSEAGGDVAMGGALDTEGGRADAKRPREAAAGEGEDEGGAVAKKSRVGTAGASDAPQ